MGPYAADGLLGPFTPWLRKEASADEPLGHERFHPPIDPIDPCQNHLDGASLRKFWWRSRSELAGRDVLITGLERTLEGSREQVGVRGTRCNSQPLWLGEQRASPGVTSASLRQGGNRMTLFPE